MTLDDVRFRARRELEQAGLSMDSAAYLVEDRPPGGWENVATKDDLCVLAAELRAEMAELRAELHKELRSQTWTLVIALVTSIGVMSAILRFV